mmetsp:Transcript_18806/g.34128  ORF Transcript_18806/g.34128 Transcript_18806/m.34128 type:complete len:307 (-) Transcript_18806:128-1048(-)
MSGRKIAVVHQPKPLNILCLHGSRQDEEIFEQRVQQLSRKLKGIANLKFISAPHELPIEEGQEVAMRCWWRNPNIRKLELNEIANSLQDSLCSLDSHKPIHSIEYKSLLQEWSESFNLIKDTWNKGTHSDGCSTSYDGILGFSNGAAASFLISSHASMNPTDFLGLRFVIIVGGYVPEPLGDLLAVAKNPKLLERETLGMESAPSSTISIESHSLPTWPIEIPSMHIFSPEDRAVAEIESQKLYDKFDCRTAKVMIHDMGHCVPQRANHCQELVSFISLFKSSPIAPPKNKNFKNKPCGKADGEAS